MEQSEEERNRKARDLSESQRELQETNQQLDALKAKHRESMEQLLGQEGKVCSIGWWDCAPVSDSSMEFLSIGIQAIKQSVSAHDVRWLCVIMSMCKVSNKILKIE